MALYEWIDADGRVSRTPFTNFQRAKESAERNALKTGAGTRVYRALGVVSGKDRKYRRVE